MLSFLYVTHLTKKAYVEICTNEIMAEMWYKVIFLEFPLFDRKLYIKYVLNTLKIEFVNKFHF